MDTRRYFFFSSREEIARANLRQLKIASGMTLILDLLLIQLTPFFFPNEWGIAPPYILLAVMAALFFIFSFLYIRQNTHPSSLLVTCICLLFCVAVLSFLITIDVFESLRSPASFMPLIFMVLPALFVLPLWQLFPLMLVSEMVYAFLLLNYKSIDLARSDLFNSLVGLLFAVVLTFIMMDLRINDNNTKLHYRRMSMTDALTGVLNKNTCEDDVREYLRCQEPLAQCALLVLDIDNFKEVNDTQGHPVGDKLLETVGTLLLGAFRATDLVGRIGGDEFMVLVKDISDPQLLDLKCQQLQDALSRVLSGRVNTHVTCSIGVAVLDGGVLSFDKAFQLADDALYEAKFFGRSQSIIHIAQPADMHCRSRRTILIADDDETSRGMLAAALEDQFEIIEASSGARTLSALSQCREELSLLILNLMMPEISGLQVLRYLRSRSLYHALPVLAIAADAAAGRDSLPLGASDVVIKPFDISDIKNRISRLLS